MVKSTRLCPRTPQSKSLPEDSTILRSKNGAKIRLPWGLAMNFCRVTKLLWSVPLLLLFAIVEVSGQHRPTYPHPPQAAGTATVESEQPQPSPRARLNPAELQQEVQELSSLAQDLTQDIDAVNRGLLPKDTVGKLKRVEKLARRLRKEIAP